MSSQLGWSELERIARARELVYPIETKREFVTQMTRSEDPVAFRGMSYDAEFAAELIPDFFFPLDSEDDLLTKASELLMARGLLAVPASTAGRAS